MGLTEGQKVHIMHGRQREILKLLKEQGPMSSIQLARKFKVGRATIFQDVRDLKARNHPIQISSMTTEVGLYVALIELKDS